MGQKFISYVRVSTDKQGKSGLGLEAQKRAIEAYLNGGNWELIDTYVEIESGKNGDRPQLNAALEACRRTGATLVIAKLDRLSRSVAFFSQLMESRVPFISVDAPNDDETVLYLKAVLAQDEAKKISERTKAALAAARARGVQLGNPDNLDDDARARGRVQAERTRKAKADDFAQRIYAHVRSDWESGASLSDLARKLNDDGTRTARGATGKWTATSIRNVLQRVNALDRGNE